MVRKKATMRRLPQVLVNPQGCISNKNILNRRSKNNIPFKIKKLLPQSRVLELKKNGQVVLKMNVRRKNIYFSGRRHLQI